MDLRQLIGRRVKVTLILFVQLFLVGVQLTNAQSPQNLSQIDDSLYPGGQEALYQNLVSGLDYPARSVQNQILGTCFLVFLIEKKEVPTYRVVMSLDGHTRRAVEAAAKVVASRFNTSGDHNDSLSYVAVIPISFIPNEFSYLRNRPVAGSTLPEVLVQTDTDLRKFRNSEFIKTEYRKEYRLGNYSNALPYLEELVRRDPFDTKSLNDLVSIMHLLGETGRACGLLRDSREFLNLAIEEKAFCNE